MSVDFLVTVRARLKKLLKAISCSIMPSGVTTCSDADGEGVDDMTWYVFVCVRKYQLPIVQKFWTSSFFCFSLCLLSSLHYLYFLPDNDCWPFSGSVLSE